MVSYHHAGIQSNDEVIFMRIVSLSAISTTKPKAAAPSQSSQSAEQTAQRMDFQRRAHPLAEVEAKATARAVRDGITQAQAFVREITGDAYANYLASRA